MLSDHDRRNSKCWLNASEFDVFMYAAESIIKKIYEQKAMYGAKYMSRNSN
jgi:hypothetical protein